MFITVWGHWGSTWCLSFKKIPFLRMTISEVSWPCLQRYRDYLARVTVQDSSYTRFFFSCCPECIRSRNFGDRVVACEYIRGSMKSRPTQKTLIHLKTESQIIILSVIKLVASIYYAGYSISCKTRMK